MSDLGIQHPTPAPLTAPVRSEKAPETLGTTRVSGDAPVAAATFQGTARSDVVEQSFVIVLEPPRLAEPNPEALINLIEMFATRTEELALVIEIHQFAQFAREANEAARDIFVEAGALQKESQAAEKMNGAVAALATSIVSSGIQAAGAIASFASGLSQFKSAAKSGDLTQQIKTDKTLLSDIKGATDVDASVSEALKADVKVHLSELKGQAAKLDASVKALHTTTEASSAGVQASAGAINSSGGYVQSASESRISLSQADEARLDGDRAKAAEYVAYFQELVKDLRQILSQILQDINQTKRNIVTRS